jgi:hypothetical protein
MRRFRTALFALTLVSQVPFAFGLAFALRLAGAPRAGWLSAALALGAVLLLGGRLGRLGADRPIPRWKLLLVEEPYYAHWLATVAAWPLLALTGAAALGHAALAPPGGAAALGSHLGAAAFASYLVALLISGYGVLVRRRWVRVRTLDVPIAGLDAAFDGYRIAQLSDLHVGGLWPRARAARWSDRVNALDVDLVALTGDYVTSGVAFHEDIAAVVSSMRARDGVVAVLGNHDYFGDAEALVTRLRARGVEVLRNQHRPLRRGGAEITIAGVDDTWSRSADVGRTVAGRDPSLPLLALAHDPQLFPELARRGAALVLSGHTHWGQLAVPFFPTRWNLSRLTYRYHAGTYREGGAILHISPGLGTTGPPVRLGAAPEITVLRLRRR